MNHPLVSLENNSRTEVEKTNLGKPDSSDTAAGFVIRLLDLPVETDADGFPITQALSALEDATAPLAAPPLERGPGGRRTGPL